ncbi:thiamine pyrophosphate-binding protein [Nocardia tengchongensis]|uniref:thiamine pyrophosphate-binding protein n=1 Tax=Nocardia tengchongensis TaxID=2055889 RepID=UPI003673C7CF
MNQGTEPNEEPGIRTVADFVVERLAAHTGHVFGVGGANIEDLYDALHRHPGVTGILAKHEFGAATMADGYARAAGRLGVVAATSGGGAMNLLAALAESFDSRVPVLALVGQPPTGLEGRGAFQDTSGAPGRIDAEQLFAQVSRYCVKVRRPEDITVALDGALAAALTGGPAILLLPKDIQAAPAVEDEASATLESAPAARRSDDHRPLPDEVAALLAGMPRGGAAVVIAGPGIAAADARAELLAAVRALDATVLVTPDAKDAYPNSDPRFAGVVGVMGHPNAARLVAEAELCLLAGAPLSLTARAGLDAALAACPRVLSLGSEPPYVPVHAEARGPLAAALREVASSIGGTPGAHLEPGSVDAQPDRLPLPELTVPPASGPGVRYRPAVAAIEAALEPGTDVVADAGNTGAAVVHHLGIPADGRFLIALGMGGMGYSFGAGIGCALGRGRRTVVIAGDGAYFMHGHEVHTAVEYQVPVTFIVFNNNAHAMCVTREQVFYSGAYSFNRFRAAEIGAGVAALFPELPVWTARTLTEFENALDKTRAIPGPAFIELQCDPDEIPPFAPFLKESFA